MALEPEHRRPLVHLSQCPTPPRNIHQIIHKTTYAPVLRSIPSAAEAMRLLRTTRPPPPRTVFILDWDDTCCATSYLERCGVMADLDIRLEECAPQLDRYLRLLEHRVLSLLQNAVKLGTVLIVTNAGDGWVELSSSRFLPAVRAFLTANYKLVKIVSARARYVDAYRQYPLQWKALTFSDELQTIMASSPCKPHDLHVVVLGDSVGDQYAARVASQSLAAAGMPIVLKVVKFLERPSIDQLCKELAVLLDHLYVMTVHRGPFDVSMYKESSQSSLSPYASHNHANMSASALPAQAVVVDQKNSVGHAHASSNRAATAPAIKTEAQHPAGSPVPSVAACAAVV